MFLNAISPSRTPSKSLNVERLMSLQKSTKHLSDADILSVAAEFSAIKRQARIADNNENAEPNHMTIPRRLFDIGGCSKNTTGTYISPDKATNTTAFGNTIHENASDSDGSASESESDAELDNPMVQAEKHFAQIIQIVNKSSGTDRAIRHRAKNTAPAATTPPPTATTFASTFSVTEVSPAHHKELSESTNATEYSHSALETDFGQNFQTEEDPEEEVNTSTLENHSACADVNGVVTASGIKDLVVRHVLSILNTGTLEEILALHGIGRVRAQRIVTARDEGTAFVSLEDLAEAANMNDKTLLKFLMANAAHIMV